MKLGVIGLGRMGRFRLEQLRLFDEAEAVIGCDPDAAARERSRELVGRTTSVIDDVWSAPGLDAVLIASSPDSQISLIRAATERGLRVAVEMPLAISADLQELSTAEHVLVLHDPESDTDWALAQHLVDSMSLGDVRNVRYVSRELRLPESHGVSLNRSVRMEHGILERFAPSLFARLFRLIATPESAFGRVFRDASGIETGFAAFFADRAGRTASLEFRIDSLIGERSGWVIDGTLTTLSRKRLYSRLPDGEILDQPAGLDSDHDAHSADLWWRRLNDRESCRRSMMSAIWAATAVAAVRESDRTGTAVTIAGRAD